ncbi:MAG: hypothetical protein ACI9DH_000833 [Halioglobus sp.]|jgi:hypothetical protein
MLDRTFSYCLLLIYPSAVMGLNLAALTQQPWASQFKGNNSAQGRESSSDWPIISNGQ